MQITDLQANDQRTIQQVAQLLFAGFADHSPSWPTLESALEEVHQSFGTDHINRIALADDGTVLGWIGGYSNYDGNVWEMHPLVVHPNSQGRGIGQALVRDFEEQVRERGGLTIMLGTDDEDGRTSLYGVDLYPNLWEHIASIRNLKHHPYEFYQKQGYIITGVVPDANGPGKPDILMAKTVRRAGLS